MEPRGRYFCPFCSSSTFKDFHSLEFHLQTNHKEKFYTSGNELSFSSSYTNLNFTKYENALYGYFSTYKASLKDKNYVDFATYFDSIFTDLEGFLSDQLEDKKHIKVYLILECRMQKLKSETYVEPVFFSSYCSVIAVEAFIPAVLTSARDKILSRIEQFSSNSSDFVVSKLLGFYCNIAKFKVKKAGSFISLPMSIMKKGAVLNIKCSSSLCFYLCVAAHLYPYTRRQKNTSAPYLNKIYTHLKMDGMPYPMDFKHIELFSKMNNVSISILGAEKLSNGKMDFFPIYCTDEYCSDEKRNIILLYLESGKSRSHFVLVKNLSRLLGHQGQAKRFYCGRCLNGFVSEEKRETHVERCKNNSLQRLKFYPEKLITFRDFKARVRSPFFIVADIETLLRPLQGSVQSSDVSYVHKVNVHEIVSWAFVIFDEFGNVVKHKTYFGKDAGQTFIQNLIIESSLLLSEFMRIKPINPLSFEERIRFESCENCEICGRKFNSNREKVKDHRHVTNNQNMRAVLCYSCNKLIADENIKINCYFHSLRYDLTYLLSGISKDLSVTFIGKRLDQLTGLEIENYLRIVDSMTLFNSSLDDAVKMLISDGNIEENFKALNQVFGDRCKDVTLLLKKLKYPYSYMDCWEKYEETELPSKEAFYNKLRSESISESEYQTLKALWKEFQLDSLKDLTLLYNLSDCVLLGACISNVAKIVYRYLGLDVTAFYTLPSLAYSAALLHGGASLQCVPDSEMYAMILAAKRGGFSGVMGTRWHKANNKYLTDYDSKKEESYIIAIDANSMYAGIQRSPLCIGSYRWLSESELEELSVDIIRFDFTNYDFFVECDLEYPNELRQINAHIQFPLLIAREKIEFDELSEIQKELVSKHTSLKGRISEKLMCSFKPKYKYVALGSNLAYYLKKGIKLTKIHRAFKFRTGTWVKNYIDRCWELRNNSSTKTTANLGKLAGNASFGKFLSCVEKYVKIQLLHSELEAEKFVQDVNFQSFRIISDSSVLASKKNGTCRIDKPTCVGVQILEKAKIQILSFWHDVICEKFPQAELCATDTDSLFFIIRSPTEDPYSWMKSNPQWFDTTNCKELGLWKDEFPVKDGCISEICALKAKAYAVRKDDGREVKKLKGTTKGVRERDIRFENYKEALFGGKLFRHQQRSLRSLDFKFHEIIENKVSLHSFDTKRKFVDLIKSVPFE